MFGEYLREQRKDAGWIQPEAASKIGIEQSYLSKLETGKAYPSDEIFQRLISTYTINTGEMLRTLSSSETDRLGDIETVRLTRLQRNKTSVARSQKWFLAGFVSLVIGVALLGLARIDMSRTFIQYAYQSTGIVLPGESLEVFAGIDDTPSPHAPDAAAQIAKRDSLIARIDDQLQLTETYKGPAFIDTVPTGKRVWRLVGGTEIQTSDRFGWANFLGLIFLLGGVYCLYVSRPWPNPAHR